MVMKNFLSKIDLLSREMSPSIAEVFHTVQNSETYSFENAKIDNFADQLSVCEDLQELTQILWCVAMEAGFQNCSLTVLRQKTYGLLRSRMCTSLSEIWTERYQSRNYQNVDPVIRRALARKEPFLFSELHSCSPMIEEFWTDCENHGIGRNGLCFVLGTNDGVRVCITYYTTKSAEKTRCLTSLTGCDLSAISILAYEIFNGITQKTQLTDIILSEVELRFLYKLATTSNLDEAKNIMQRYGSKNSLQASIRMKLGVSTIFQALAIACSNKWFDELPFDNADYLRPFPELEGWELAVDLLDSDPAP
jgi:hypothetical protein